MWQFIKNILSTIIGVFLSFVILFFALAGIIGAAAVSGSKSEVTVHENSVLELDLATSFPEKPKKNPFEGLESLAKEFKMPISLYETLEAIREAKTDKNIKAIYIKANPVNEGWATLQEIRNALLDFKKSGKKVYAYSEVYLLKNYYIASLSDSIFFNRSGLFNFAGLSSEQMFLKGMFDKLDIEPKLIRVGKYKSAGEMFIRNDMSEANREQVSSYLNSVYNHFLAGVGVSRNLDPAYLFNIANEGKVKFPSDAKREKLVDKLCYEDEVLKSIKNLCGIKEKKSAYKSISIYDYNKHLKGKDKEYNSDKIAIVFAVGEINSGEGSEDGIGSETMAQAIREARLDEKVKAVVLRINSPGGSAMASDIIWREVKLCAQAKPVVASFGDVAASGGYYIAAPATQIVAQPNTITGSIGVFGLIPNLTKFWVNKTGIHWDRVKTGKYADLGNPNRPMSAEEEAIIQQYIDTIYVDFKSKVAEGRKMDMEAVENIAQGRVWTGIQAQERKLVDKLGNLNDAVDVAKKLAKLDKYYIKILPHDEDGFGSMFSNFMHIREDIVKSELKEFYPIYKQAQKARDRSGVMMWLPYESVD